MVEYEQYYPYVGFRPNRNHQHYRHDSNTHDPEMERTVGVTDLERSQQVVRTPFGYQWDTGVANGITRKFWIVREKRDRKRRSTKLSLYEVSSILCRMNPSQLPAIITLTYFHPFSF